MLNKPLDDDEIAGLRGAKTHDVWIKLIAQITHGRRGTLPSDWQEKVIDSRLLDAKTACFDLQRLGFEAQQPGKISRKDEQGFDVLVRNESGEATVMVTFRVCPGERPRVGYRLNDGAMKFSHDATHFDPSEEAPAPTKLRVEPE